MASAAFSALCRAHVLRYAPRAKQERTKTGDAVQENHAVVLGLSDYIEG